MQLSDLETWVWLLIPLLTSWETWGKVHELPHSHGIIIHALFRELLWGLHEIRHGKYLAWHIEHTIPGANASVFWTHWEMKEKLETKISSYLLIKSRLENIASGLIAKWTYQWADSALFLSHGRAWSRQSLFIDGMDAMEEKRRICVPQEGKGTLLQPKLSIRKSSPQNPRDKMNKEVQTSQWIY